MRPMKMFGLAAVAAVSATAFIGASSASATSTVFCSENVLVCPAAKKIEHATFTALSTSPFFSNAVANMSCTHTVFSGNVLLLANPLVGHVSLWDFTGCSESIFGSKCTIATNNSWLFYILKIGPNKGTLSMEGAEMLINCSSIGFHCIYGNPTTSLSVAGSVGTALAAVVATSVTLPKKGGGFFCPETSSLSATYTVTTPDPVYIAE